MIIARKVIPSDVISIDGADYYVAEIHTKGKREKIDFDIVRPVEGKPLKIVYEYTKSAGNDPTAPVFWDTKTNKWRHKDA